MSIARPSVKEIIGIIVGIASGGVTALVAWSPFIPNSLAWVSRLPMEGSQS
jgi:hypothetical protein